MKKSELAIRTAMASLVSIGLVASSQNALAAKGDQEKCFGVVKAGKNDCASAGNACAGQVKMDGAKDAWVYLPKGSCEKIVGGSLVVASNAVAPKDAGKKAK